jgi:hypothetical protein
MGIVLVLAGNRTHTVAPAEKPQPCDVERCAS